MDKKSESLTLRLPAGTKRRLDHEARRRGVNRCAIVTRFLDVALDALEHQELEAMDIGIPPLKLAAAG